MRKLVWLLLVASCTAERSADDLVPCGASWGLEGSCEPSCTETPMTIELGCDDADNPVGGHSSCQRTFARDGAIGCCKPDTDDDGHLLVRFYACR